MRDSITKHIIYTARRSQLCVGSRLEKYNITAAEEPFFMAIQSHAGAAQEELTSLVGVDKAATTRAICALESKGYLTRRQDEQDRRQKRIYATEKAMQLGAEVKRELLQLNDEILSGISAEERDVLYQALLKMEKNLDRIKR
ncbi:MAG: MarR family transcriptional regulator [Eubacteriales bacterium]|nr:MarR family transcriptional regulator [Eubacteriales bacterium]